jgi:hypothetical protein
MMFFKTLNTLFFVLLLTGCGGASGGESDDDDDDYIHNQGRSCLECHGPGEREADEELIRTGGTVFETINAADRTAGALGYTVRLRYADDATLTLQRRSRNRMPGNVYSSAAVTGAFTAEVIDDLSSAVVNTSAALSHPQTSGDCNRCHTAAGTDSAPGRIVSSYTAAATGAHNQGQRCLACHATGTDGAPILAMGGTLYTKLNAPDGEADTANGFSLRLRLASGTLHALTPGKGAGNYHAQSGVGESFTAEVLDGAERVVNRSLENSHTADRLNCNRCHSENGSEGASGRMVSDASSAFAAVYDGAAVQTPGFTADVMPILQNRCRLCHTSIAPVIGDANVTYANLQAVGFVTVVERVDGTLSHTGGALLKGTNRLQTIQNWIGLGANND